MTPSRQRASSLGTPSGTVLPFIALVLSLLQIHCLFTPEDKRSGPEDSNSPPTVEITGGAATKEPIGVDYRVQFRWIGTDTDGTIAGFEYATDDTSRADAWQYTTESQVGLVFSATMPDRDQPGTATDWHSFHVRAIDDDGAVSTTRSQRFNARTVAPSSRVTTPSLTSSRLPRLFANEVIEWVGSDIDATSESLAPTEWEYRLVRIDNVVLDPPEEIADSIRVGSNLFLEMEGEADTRAWKRVSGGIRSVGLPGVEEGDQLAFAVRAIDEAGATEPDLEEGRNLFRFIVRISDGVPILTVSERSVGEFVFLGRPPTWEVSVPSETALNFEWIVDASQYGRGPGPVNYAIDIPDPEDETLGDPRGIGGWIGWSDRTGVDFPVVFDASEAGRHQLWIKARDDRDRPDREVIELVEITVVPFTFERPVLVIDDSKFSRVPPTDAEHDEFLATTLLRKWFDEGDVDHLSMYGNPERSTPVGLAEITLESLARYSTVIWHSQVATTVSIQPLWDVQENRSILSSYLSGGGRLFMTGGRLSSFLVERRGDFGYPKTAPGRGEDEADFTTDSFIYRFLKIRSEVVSVAWHGPQSEPPQREASGLIGLRPLNPSFPEIEIDPAHRDPYIVEDQFRFRGGIVDWEGFRSSPRLPVEIPGLDPIYAPITMDTTLRYGSVRAGYENAVVAWRYHSTAADTMESTQQGRTVVLDFQPYWFRADQVEEAGRLVADWIVSGSP